MGQAQPKSNPNRRDRGGADNSVVPLISLPNFHCVFSVFVAGGQKQVSVAHFFLLPESRVVRRMQRRLFVSTLVDPLFDRPYELCEKRKIVPMHGPTCSLCRQLRGGEIRKRLTSKFRNFHTSLVSFALFLPFWIQDGVDLGPTRLHSGFKESFLHECFVFWDFLARCENFFFELYKYHCF